MAIRARFCALSAFLILCLCSSLAAASLTSDEQRLLGFISGLEIKETVTDLCCDRFEGRRAGAPGHALTARYIADRFASIGMDRVAGSYTQDLTMRYALVKRTDDIAAVLTYHTGPKSIRKSFAYPDYYGRGGINVSAPVVFVGRGITDSQSGRDDYGAENVSGKVAVWLAGSSSGRDVGETSVLARVTNAYKHGAVASLIVGLKSQIDQQCGAFGLSGPIADFPCLSISRETARALFPRSWDCLAAGALGNRSGPRVGNTVSITVPSIYNPSQPTRNVLCVLPGSGEGKEVVLLGAHYDHLGVENGKAFPGADDNASGSAVVMEVAKAFAKSGLKPKRSIVFAAWTAEEAGLVGCNYFANNPPFPLGRLKAAVNMDMVGVGDRGCYKTVGRRPYPEQFRVLSTSSDDLGLRLLSNEAPGVSDHLAFMRKGVPSLLVYSAGEHPYFHTPRDRPELVDPVILSDTARLVALTMWRLANVD